MAFQFPDPNVTPEFEGDNGIFYIWDPVDEKWTIKGFKADLDDRYVNKLGGDSMEGPLELTGPDGNLKFGTSGGKIVSSSDTALAVINSSGVFYDGNISTERHLVNKGYVDDQIDEVVGLLGGIGSSNKAGVFTWQASGTLTPGSWQFEGRANPDYEYAGLNQINISKVDKAGNSWTVDDFPINEILRIEDESDGHFLEGHITAVVDGGPSSIQVTYTIDEANGTADGDQVISVGENLDHKFVERTGDSMIGDLEMGNSKVDFTNMGANRVAIQAKRGDGEDLTLFNLLNAGVSPAVSGFYDIKIQGNTFYNGIRIKGGSGAADTLWEIRGGSGEMKFFGSASFEGRTVKNVGTAIDDSDAITFGQVRDELLGLRDDLITDLSFGTWRYSSGSVTPLQGRFYGAYGSSPIGNADPRTITAFNLNAIDVNGNAGPFDRVDVGEMIVFRQGGLEARYRVNSTPATNGSSNEARRIEVNFVSRNQSFYFVDGTDWNIQLIELNDIDADALDDTYLRIDCDNSPLVTMSGLEIKTDSTAGSGFGEASLTLNGKRDNNNNSAASIKFKNWNYDDTDDVNGYITYRTNGTAAGGFFRFSKSIDLLSNDVYNVQSLKLKAPGSIWSDTNERIKFKTASTAENGDGLVEFTRPNSNGRRGFTIRGKDTSNADNDILYTYTNSSGGDAINYVGKQVDNSANLATTAYVKSYVDANGGGVDVRTDNPSNPAIGHMWYNKSTSQLLLRIS